MATLCGKPIRGPNAGFEAAFLTLTFRLPFQLAGERPSAVLLSAKLPLAVKRVELSATAEHLDVRFSL